VKRRAALGLAILLATISIGGQPAHADFRICNDASLPVEATFGFFDKERGWIGRGWLVLNVGQCKNAINGELWNRYYYWYAWAQDKNQMEHRWTGDTPFCIKFGGYKIEQAQYGGRSEAECGSAGLLVRNHRRVDVNGAKDYTLRITGLGGDEPGAGAASVAPPPQNQPSPPSPSPVTPGGGGGSAACQRYPNLC
jgi:uncharacterized membrane protein